MGTWSLRKRIHFLANAGVARTERVDGLESREGELKASYLWHGLPGSASKKNYPAGKIRVDIFKDKPGIFFPVGENFPGSSSKKSTRIFAAG